MNSTVSGTSLYEAQTLNEKGERYLEFGRYHEAEGVLRHAAELMIKALGADSPQLAPILDNLARALAGLKNYSEAESSYKRAIEIIEKAYYAEHPRLGAVLDHLGQCLMEQQKYEEAAPVLKRAMDIAVKAHRPEHPAYLASIRKAASAYICLSQYAEAEPLLKKAHQVADSPWGPVEDLLYDLASLYEAEQKYEDAEKTYEQAIAAFEQRGKPGRLAKCMHSFAELLRKMNKNNEASGMETRARLIGASLPDSE